MIARMKRQGVLWVALLAAIVLAGVVACGSDEEAASAEDIAKAVSAQMGPQLTSDDVQKIVDASAGGGLTAAEVQKIVSDSTGQQLTAADVQKIVDASAGGGLTAADVQKVVNEAVSEAVAGIEVQAAAPGSAEEKVLTVRMANMSPQFTPHTQGRGDMAQIGAWIWSRIAQADPTAGQWSPDLAQRWSLSDDFSSMTFNLRPAALWHDGTPVTTKDIEYTVRSFLHPEESSWMLATMTAIKGGKDFQEGLVDSVAGVQIQDDFTHHYRVRESDHQLPGRPEQPVRPGSGPGPSGPQVGRRPRRGALRAFLLEGRHDRLRSVEFHSVGAGPVPRDDGLRRFLLRQARHRQDHHVDHPIERRDADRASGGVRWTRTSRGGVSVEAQEALLADPRFDVWATMGTHSGGWSFNMRVPVINDPRLHQAWAYCMDRKTMFPRVRERTRAARSDPADPLLVPEARVGRDVPVRSRQGAVRSWRRWAGITTGSSRC